MKNLLFALSLTLLISNLAAQPSDLASSRPFLSNYARSVVTHASQIKAEPLKAMLYTPRLMPMGSSELSRTLSQKQSKALLEMLLVSPDFDPSTRLSNCHFEPGIRFLFYPNISSEPKKSPDLKNQSAQLSILLCLNCNVWAIGKDGLRENSSDLPIGIGAFGDLEPQRAVLIELINQIFEGQRVLG